MKSEKIIDVWLSPTIMTPIGDICAAASPVGLIQVWFGKTDELEKRLQPAANIHSSSFSLLDDALTQLEGYFTGNRQTFDLPLDLSRVTQFQKLVLSAVQQVPFGVICSYGEIARRINHPKAVRAVGQANGSNPIPIIIPCHRIIGKDRKLHGYSMPGGIKTKAWLLEHEGHHLEEEQSSLISV